MSKKIFLNFFKLTHILVQNISQPQYWGLNEKNVFGLREKCKIILYGKLKL